MMLFRDGNRLDLTLVPIEKPELISNDSATIVLLDKDNTLPSFPEASDKDYYVKAPNDFNVALGKMGKYFKNYLPLQLYEMYEQTYSDSSTENFWGAIYAACELFRRTAGEVAEYFGYTYNREDDENMMIYFQMVQEDR